MSTSEQPGEGFDLSAEAAELYESAFVPAFFAQWAPVICDAAGVAAGQRVLDVACGTGIVARTAANLISGDGTVVGVDANPAMLAVARRVCPDIDFRHGDATALPFPDASFDAALCQMALMFFPDPAKALREMARVVKPGGRLALLVPAALPNQPAFAPFVEMAARQAGAEAMSLLSAYFACGDLNGLTSMVAKVGLEITSAQTQTGTYRAASVDAFVTTEVESTPLRTRISEKTYQHIRSDAYDVLAPFTTADGRIEAPFNCNLVSARHP